MSRLYILGGKQRNPELRETEEWRWYESAIIAEVDTTDGDIQTRVEYRTPAAACAGDDASINFHAGILVANELYTCTRTEVLCYSVPDFSLIRYLSLPCFNDLHHVTRASDGNLLIANTGLEMVLKITAHGRVLAQWSALGGDPWARFSPAIDYRRVASTKPHASHPNFVFELDGEIWATRFHQRDAVCLNRPHRRIDLAGEFPHDGLIVGPRIYFTAVDGKIVIVDRESLRLQGVVDLRAIQDRDGVKLPAWCRGILPVDDRRIWVGFTRIRKTKFQENVRWLKQTFREGTIAKPTHIALFDVQENKCLQEIDLERHGINAVYGILPATAVNSNYTSIESTVSYPGVSSEIDTGLKF